MSVDLGLSLVVPSMHTSQWYAKFSEDLPSSSVDPGSAPRISVPVLSVFPRFFTLVEPYLVSGGGLDASRCVSPFGVAKSLRGQ